MYFIVIVSVGDPTMRSAFLYRSSTRGPEDDSEESKHVAPLSHYMFNFTTVVFDGTSPAFYSYKNEQHYIPDDSSFVCIVTVLHKDSR